MKFTVDKISEILKNYKEEVVVKAKDLPSVGRLKKHFQKVYEKDGIVINEVKKYNKGIYLYTSIPKDFKFHPNVSTEITHIDIKEQTMIIRIGSYWFDQIKEKLKK